MTIERSIPRNGLSEFEAAKQLSIYGFNELPSAKPRSFFAIAYEVVKEPMFLLLVGCAAIYLVLGDTEEALMLASAVCVVMGITIYQERKTENALEALKDLSSPRALVIRSGVQKRIAGREVVPGDIVVLAEGDRVPADGILLSGLNVLADESLLTGESLAVRKCESNVDRPIARPGGDDLPFVYAGTLIVGGHGLALVKTTAINTEIGKIGKSLMTLEQDATLLQKNTNRLVRTFAAIGFSLCAVVTIVYALSRDGWLNGLLAGLTMAIAMVPEEFPVVLTIFLSLGAWRIAQQNVLTRRVPAIETLGAATTLCVDKTGTITQNKMSLVKISIEGRTFNVADGHVLTSVSGARELITIAALACQPEPFDPMEKAIREIASQLDLSPEVDQKDRRLLRQYPLTPEMLAMSQVWSASDDESYLVATKGAPEAIAKLCRLDEHQQRTLTEEVKALAIQGHRVLAVARGNVGDTVLPNSQDALSLVYLGLIAFHDPIRPATVSAVRECYQAGIRVIMITGDYPDTARSIAQQIGLNGATEIVTGEELTRMSAVALGECIQSVNVFARVMPEQKLMLVNALKERGEIVAMTGDGVNDAPALRAAHIGIAMGMRGTDVAREAADLVLLDDDFASIVKAIRLGRRIYTNIKDAMAYIMAIHVPIAGLSLIPVLLEWPLILMPIHIVFLELIIDPACATVFEAAPEEEDVMRRNPRDPMEPLFTRRALGISLLQGASVLFFVLAVFAVALYRGQGELDARALTFTSLVIANVGLILTNLSWSRSILEMLKSPNLALRWVLAGVTVSLILALYVPFLRQLFKFSLLHPLDIALCLSVGGLSIVWFEVFKLLRRSYSQSSARSSRSA